MVRLSVIAVATAMAVALSAHAAGFEGLPATAKVEGPQALGVASASDAVELAQVPGGMPKMPPKGPITNGNKPGQKPDPEKGRKPGGGKKWNGDRPTHKDKKK